MPANDNKTQTQRKSTATTAGRSGSAQVREGVTKARNGAVTYVRQGSERAVDVPVGVALTAADRVNELVQPFTQPDTRERELRSLRQRVEREFNRFERRGGTARRKTLQRARQTRNRVEREVRQRRRKLETTVRQRRRGVETALRQNRRRAEDGLKRAQTAMQERVSTLV
jgi:hypothetical protein